MDLSWISIIEKSLIGNLNGWLFDFLVVVGGGGFETTNEFFEKTFVHVVFLWFSNFKWVFFNHKDIILWCSIKRKFKWSFIGSIFVVMGFVCRNEWFYFLLQGQFFCGGFCFGNSKWLLSFFLFYIFLNHFFHYKDIFHFFFWILFL